MGFLAPSLLAGLALVALPIVLHLVMRREPQRVEFPALRFVRKRQMTNQHRLKLRHWLLLALRCALVAVLAFALARPVLRGSGLLGGQHAGLAAALVIDTSPRMQYRQQNTTRLETAQELATWLLEQLPGESEVAVVDPARPRRAQLGPRDAALLRTERLRASAAAPSLAEATEQAIALVSERPDHRREVYVFTDLAEVVWNDEAQQRVRQTLDAHPGVELYLVDVGVPRPANRGLGTLELSSQHLAAGESLSLRAPLARTPDAEPGEATVELWIEGSDGQLQKRGEQRAGADDPAVEFTLAGLEPGVHQGHLQLTGNDPLPIDDRRYFTVEVRPPRRLLLVGSEPRDVLLLREALAPSAGAELSAPRFACETIGVDQLAGMPLAGFDAVILSDPPPPSPQAWRELADYVQAGGGLAIALGRNAVGNLDQFNAPAPQVLIPGPLEFVTSVRTYLQPTSYQHPVFHWLADLADATPWNNFPVFRYWELGPLDPTATLVAQFADGAPAITEQLLGGGRVLTFTTPLSDPASRNPWNLLPTNPDPWPYLAMAEGLADHLVGADTRSLNGEAGQVMSLSAGRRADLATYVLETPVGDPLPRSFTPGQTEIVVTNTTDVGNYRVSSGGERARLDQGFSINARGDVGELARVEFGTLAESLGTDRVHLATSERELTSTIDLGRVGRELYPWAISLLALVLAGEQLLSDLFYARRDRS